MAPSNTNNSGNNQNGYDPNKSAFATEGGQNVGQTSQWDDSAYFNGNQPQKKTGLFSSANPAEKQQLKRVVLTSLITCLAVLLIVGIGVGIFMAVTGKSFTTKLGSEQTTLSNVDDSDTLAEAVATKCLPSVVSVNVYAQTTSGTLQQSSMGSGVIISNEGHLVTNQHVVDGGSVFKINVNGNEVECDKIGEDSSSDIAVLKAKNTDSLVPIQIADSDQIKIGEWVMAIGNPFGLEQSVSTGIVSATSRSQVVSSSTDGTTKIYPNLIQTDAAINPGNSGGALVDANGQLIGINALITSSSGNYSGVGFAIPSNYAIDLAKQIIDGKTPSHAQLGITMTNVDSSNSKQYGWSVDKGAYVTGVTSNGPADQAGIKVGDIITKFGDKQITSTSDLSLAVRSHNPNDKVSVEVVRGNETVTMDVTLGTDNGQTQQKQQSNSSNSYGYGDNSNSYDLDDLFKYFFGY